MQPSHYQNPGQNSIQQQQPWGGPFPALHMWPLHETFQMKMIYLPDSQRIKIGRQTNAKTVPGERNAFFDSKVLSRLHAEVWEQNGKIFIRDSKSSNGTFINGERLSPEGVESEPFELKSEDLVEFGIDIVSDDSRTIIHHKVASKVYCVLNVEDANFSARELAHYQNANRRLAPAAAPGPAVPIAMSSGGKANGLSFEHVMMKLQTELAKSRETGAELQELTGSMGDIQDTLGGGLPPSQNGIAAQLIPPQFRSSSAEAKAALAGPHGQQAAAFIALQNQLSETQSSLNAHIDRIRGLESSLNQSETVRAEVAVLREQMEESKREMDMLVAGGARGRTFDRRMTEENEDDDDDDDTGSVVTVMDNQDPDERPAKRGKIEGVNGVTGGISNGDRHDQPSTETSKTIEEMSGRNQELASRVQTLSEELSEATRLSQHLQSQHDEAMSALGTLTQRIESLEMGLAGRIAEAVGESDRKWETWRVHVEDGWKTERESWEAERERLRGVVRDWEEASRRANEEEEDRALNERLSADELSDEEEDENEPVGAGSTSKRPITGGRKLRRRRPSNRTTLALRALRDVSNTEGQSTPTQTASSLRPPEEVPNTAQPRKEGDEGSASGGSDKLSTESGKESVDTLRDRDAGVKLGKGKRAGTQLGDAGQRNQVPFFTVLVVAVFAGALYYRHKE